MKKSSAFFILCLFIQQLYAQYTFVKQWDKRYGGNFAEGPVSLSATTDAGFVLGGFSTSDISGDKTQARWGSNSSFADYWIIKIDSLGNKQWDKRFGGTSDDVEFGLQATKEGGYILGGHSGSGISGDKTEAIRGNYDYWLVKINASGTKEWDKRFGGTGLEEFATVIQTIDGGYLAGGYSTSGIGGDKTEEDRDPSHFYGDYWVVKIDSLGNKQWDKTLGGSDDDFLRSVQQTNDGGYILAGWSYSGANGDKTQTNWDTSNPLTPDWWVVKIDSAGNKEWDKRFGTDNSDGLRAILETIDGGYLLAGGAGDTGVNGDKTTSKGGMWIVKINNIGNIVWQKSYETGSGVEVLTKTNDNGYLISGQGARSDMLVYPATDRTENCWGVYNTLVVKLDSNGNKQWDKTIFTDGEDQGGYAMQTADGCYAVANQSSAGVGGYKSQAAWNNSSDFFIVKFCMEETTGIDEAQEITGNSQISVYPNPFTSDVSISLHKENLHQATFTITNLIGQTIYNREETNLATNYTKMLDLSYLPNGVYFLEVTIDRQRTVKQLVKQ